MLCFSIRIGQSLGHLTLLTCLSKLKLAGGYDAMLQLANSSWEELQCLHTLHLCRAVDVPQGIGRMQNLHHLDLETLQAEICDLSSCIHLTHLKVHWRSSRDGPEHVVLPSGRQVQLQSLRFSSVAEGLMLGRLKNLQAAARLSSLTSQGCCFVNMLDGPWPRSLPALQVLRMTRSPIPLPETVQSYANLHDLEFSHASTLLDEPNPNASNPLPHWCSQSTQLESLRLPYDRSVSFPSCMLSLNQLETLTLCSNSLSYLPMGILTCASWPSLTHLDICSNMPLNDASLDSNLVRLRLQAAFAAIGRQCVLNV